MNYLLKSIFLGLAGLQGMTLLAESRPKLVVGIMVDQLRTDYLENLKDMLSAGGFKRLMEQGVYFNDVDFKIAGGDAASATAIIQTGAYPRQNGITAASIFDQNSKSLKSVFYDDKFLGNSTSETYSPGSLRVNTLTDELSVDEKGKSRIHSIAPEAEQAIVLAGHTGNSAFWINNETGRWASTTYYSSLPTILQNKNYQDPLISRLDTMKWIPLRAGEPYPGLSLQESRNGFRHSFSRSDKDVFTLYKNSPFVNKDITDSAIEYIQNLNLGNNSDATDVLNLGYTLSAYPNLDNSTYKYELQDSYLRLDKDLERLFSSLDKQVGRDKVLVYLVSTGYFEEPVEDYQQYRLPGGTFSVKRAISLLNAYLSAQYGNGAYVDQYADHHIYLNKKLLEEKQLDIAKIAEDSRTFLVRMSGVADAYTNSDLMSPSIADQESFRRSIDPRTGGDIILVFNPGWTVVDDSRYPSLIEKNKSNAYLFPGFIMGAGIVPDEIKETVDATVFAPTVAKNLHIRSPNSSVSKPLSIK